MQKFPDVRNLSLYNKFECHFSQLKYLIYNVKNHTRDVSDRVWEVDKMEGVPWLSPDTRAKFPGLTLLTVVMAMTSRPSWGWGRWRASSRWQPTRHPTQMPFLLFVFTFWDGLDFTRHNVYHVGSVCHDSRMLVILSCFRCFSPFSCTEAPNRWTPKMDIKQRHNTTKIQRKWH